MARRIGCVGRRGLLRWMGAAAAVGFASAPSAAVTAGPASVVSQPSRRWGADADPVLIPDPDVLVLDEGFRPRLVGNAIIERAWTGGDWLEGPAWSAVGRFLVFSDTPRNRQHRFLWETGGVSVFREPSFHSNGNCFDLEGRHVVCEHFNRRVVRFGHDGLMRVLADNFEGRPLNSPNDAAAHPRDGSLWFTDPAYGTTLAEGRPDEAGGPTNPDGRLHPRVGAELAGAFGGGHRQPAGVYRWDPDGGGRVERALGEDELASPNGVAFSPDGQTLYVSSTGQTPGVPPPPAGDNAIHAYDVVGKGLRNGRVLSGMVVDGVPCPPDGIKVDVSGHLWCASSGPLGHAGVVVLDTAGKPVCRIRLPEACSNLCFGGPRRNMLFMMATRSLYRLQVNTQGAAPG